MKKNVQIVSGKSVPTQSQEIVLDDDFFTSHALSDPKSLTSSSLERRSPTPESNPCGDFSFLEEDDFKLEIDSDSEDILSQEKDNSNDQVDRHAKEDSNSKQSADPLCYPSLSDASLMHMRNLLKEKFPQENAQVSSPSSAPQCTADNNKKNHPDSKKKNFSKKDRNQGSAFLGEFSFLAPEPSDKQKRPASLPVPISGRRR